MVAAGGPEPLLAIRGIHIPVATPSTVPGFAVAAKSFGLAVASEGSRAAVLALALELIVFPRHTFDALAPGDPSSAAVAVGVVAVAWNFPDFYVVPPPVLDARPSADAGSIVRVHRPA